MSGDGDYGIHYVINFPHMLHIERATSEVLNPLFCQPKLHKREQFISFFYKFHPPGLNNIWTVDFQDEVMSESKNVY